MKKSILFLFVILCFCLIISSCDAGLRILDIEIASYPDKLFYVIGVDKDLDLEGGTVYLISRDTPKGEYSEEMSGRAFEIEHNIDFQKEGIYTVTIKRAAFYDTFPIQVVSKETLESILRDMEP